MTGPRYLPASEYRIDEFDGVEANQFVVSAPDGRVWFLSAGAVALLRATADGGTPGEIATRLGVALGRSVDAASLRQALDQQLVSVGLIRLDGDRLQVQHRASALTFRVQLIPGSAVQWLTRRLLWLMPEGRWFWIATAIVISGAFWVSSSASRLGRGTSSASISIAAFGLMVLSTLLHELGHATACTKSGARSGHIGFGMYWYFPVLYTSLDDVWRLPRWERARVDVAGILFQAGFVLVASLVALAVPDSAILFRGLPFLLLLALGSALNPLLQFDGYWLLSDLSGVHNLRAQSFAVLRHLLGRSGRTAHRESAAVSRVPRLPRHHRRALAAYATAGVAFSISLAVAGLSLLSGWFERADYAHFWIFARHLNPHDPRAALPGAVTTLEYALPAIIGVFLILGCVRSTRGFFRQVLA
jgi:putative peptide zinc metalloprotease protein